MSKDLWGLSCCIYSRNSLTLLADTFRYYKGRNEVSLQVTLIPLRLCNFSVPSFLAKEFEGSLATTAAAGNWHLILHHGASAVAPLRYCKKEKGADRRQQGTRANTNPRSEGGSYVVGLYAGAC